MDAFDGLKSLSLIEKYFSKFQMNLSCSNAYYQTNIILYDANLLDEEFNHFLLDIYSILN